MKAEILSIGSEMTSGRNLDTNGQWLSRRLGEIGIPVGFHTTVADHFQDNVDVFRTAMNRAEVVLCTGGLGPTQDDLTREVIAAMLGVNLEEDSEAIVAIEAMFTRRGRVMPPRNRVQALVPQGCEGIPNRVGTAPGVWVERQGRVLAAMPGIPSEMHIMYHEQVKPRLLKLGLGGGLFMERKINTFGMGESAVEEKLLDLTRRDHRPEVGITVGDATVSLRILSTGQTIEEVQAQTAPIEAIIRQRLGELVFGVDDQELQEVVVNLAREKLAMIGCAEGVTGGLLTQRLAAVPGASAVLKGGIIAYDRATKIEELRVDPALIDKHGLVSREVAIAMAEGLRARWGVTIALATVGIAGPGGSSDEQPVGTVWAAIASPRGSQAMPFSWLGTRAEIQSRTAKLALNLARLELMHAG